MTTRDDLVSRLRDIAPDADDMPCTYAVMLEAADKAANEARRRAPIAVDPEIGRITRQMLGAAGATDAGIARAATARRVDSDRSEPGCHLSKHAAQRSIQAA